MITIGVALSQRSDVLLPLLALNEILNIVLLVKDDQSVARKLAIFQIGSERMYNKVFLRLFAIHLQGITEYGMKTGTGS